jgi:hypothetical protein
VFDNPKRVDGIMEGLREPTWKIPTDDTSRAVALAVLEEVEDCAIEKSKKTGSPVTALTAIDFIKIIATLKKEITETK